MIDQEKKKEAKQNFDKYLQDGLIKKEKNETANCIAPAFPKIYKLTLF